MVSFIGPVGTCNIKGELRATLFLLEDKFEGISLRKFKSSKQLAKEEQQWN